MIGNMFVIVGFDGGVLLDVGGDLNIVRFDLGVMNSNFDLLFILREFDFGKLLIFDDLMKLILNKIDEGFNGCVEGIGVGDMWGMKEGWYLIV